MSARGVLSDFRIDGPDADGLLWLVLHGAGTPMRAMINLGKDDGYASALLLTLETNRRAALEATP